MPGSTPRAAVQAFLEPFKEGLRLFDITAVIAVTEPVRADPDKIYTWVVNRGGGTVLTDVGTFFASMKFQIVHSDPNQHDQEHQGVYRCSTRAYNYKLTLRSGTDLWRIHWHPGGVSTESGPHVHPGTNLKLHLPTPRLTFENALAWLIQFGAPLRTSADEARIRLAELEASHLLYRSWSVAPNEPRG